jgi:hypothetical protein
VTPGWAFRKSAENEERSSSYYLAEKALVTSGLISHITQADFNSLR